MDEGDEGKVLKTDWISNLNLMTNGFLLHLSPDCHPRITVVVSCWAH